MTSPLPHYQALVHTGTQMVAAAMQGQWTEVSRLESVAREQVTVLRPLMSQAAWSHKDRAARRQALIAILRLDAQVRALAEPGWRTVQPWLGLKTHLDALKGSSLQGQVDSPLADRQGKH